MKTVATLVIVHDDEKVLLGMKKRGFGEGLWNGFGGKISDGETIEQAAMRELEEEVGLIAKELIPKGQMTFEFIDSTNTFEVHLFALNDYEGVILETEEMQPQWFHYNEIPYEQMWKDDIHWLPYLLEGKKVRGTLQFDNPKSQNIIKNGLEIYV